MKQLDARPARLADPVKNNPAGCSKRPAFSPAQPWRAETRLVPGKAAASDEARRTLRYIEPLSDARTQLAAFFNSLLVDHSNRPTTDIQRGLVRSIDGWVPIAGHPSA